MDFVGVAGTMPGTDGFTMAAFRADQVPVGTSLYVKSKSSAWQTGTPPVKENEYQQFIIAVRRAHDLSKVFVTTACYANNYNNDDLHDRDGNPYVADGWYDLGLDASGEFNDLFMPALNLGDVLMGWQELPKWEFA